jgi:Ca2+-binding RTX toxin-like protein
VDPLAGGGGNADLVIATLHDTEGYTLGGGLENLTLIYAGTLLGGIAGIGNALANKITGSSVADSTLEGGAGLDTLIGGLGDDVYLIDLTATPVGALEDKFSDTGGIDSLMVSGNDSMTSSFKYTMAGGLENINLDDTGAIALTIIGNPLANSIEGNVGDDSLDGAAGNDTLNGCIGGNDTLLGGDGNDELAGGADNDSLSGGAGNDRLDGDAGNDSMDGGLGNDSYGESFGDDLFVIAQAGDNIDVVDNAGIDTVRVALAGNAYLDLRGGNSFLENVVFTGTGSVQLFGNDSANQLTGGAGNDSLSGGLAIDTLSGGAGMDTLDGGAGADSMSGGAGNDRYLVDDAADSINESMAGGTDTVIASVDGYVLAAQVENLTLAGAAITGTGNAGANTIVGNDNDNFLYGGGGNDVVTGGAGDDSFVLGSVSAGNVMRITDYAQDLDRIYLDGPLSALIGSLVDGTNLINANTVPTAVNSVESLIYAASSGSLYYDATGGATTDKILIATFDLAHRPYAMHADDFYTT